MPDDALAALAAAELETIGILRTSEVLDAHVVRVPKTYPAYFGTYTRFDELRAWDGQLHQPLPRGPQRHAQVQQPGPLHADRDGRGGRHRRGPQWDKQALWSINTEQEYHEEKK